MITFKKYADIVNAIAKKLKVTKDKAINALIKAQQKGINPLRWQKYMTMLQTFAKITAEYDPTIDERQMTDKQALVQIQHYWDDLDHMASDDTKKKSMQRLGYKNIKLDSRGKITSFDEDRDYKDEYKKFQSSEKMRKYRSELNKYNREKGTYGNRDGKDASHKDGKIVGMEDQHEQRQSRKKQTCWIKKKMKSFKGYLQEKFQDWKSGSAPAWTESLSTMLFDLPRAGLKDLKIPLSPSIMSRVWPKSVK